MAPIVKLLLGRNSIYQKINYISCAQRVGIANFTTGCKRKHKIVKGVNEALEGIQDGDSILVGGFGHCGIPEKLICGVANKAPKYLTVISCSAGTDNYGPGILIRDKLVKRIVASYIGECGVAEKQFFNGELEVELTPQGSLAERIRAGGAGIPAFFVPCGLGTLIHEGGAPIKYKNNVVIEVSSGKPDEEFNGKNYVMETAITAKFALAKAWKADAEGNVMFRKSARNFNPVVLTAAEIAVVEVEEIVPVGALDPDDIHLPGIFVDRILLGTDYEKPIEKRTIKKTTSNKTVTPAQVIRDRIARRAALELRDGMYVNLGIGVPSFVALHIPKNVNVHLQSDNGIIGLGPHPSESEVDPDLVNASKELATILTGGVFFDCVTNFDMIRGGHLDVSILGAMQVSQYGDIANWMIPGKLVRGMGGAMDLVSAPGTKVIVMMEHNAKDGSHKILSNCDLPLTGKGCVNMIITEKCVFEVDPEEGLTLTEIAEGIEVPEIIESTGAEFAVSPDLKPMGQICHNE